MKVCPYCAEEIQSDAIKCKHCGEWLNKTKTKDFIGSLKSSIGSLFSKPSEQKKIAEQKPHDKIFNPINYKEITLYNTHLQFQDTRIEFDEIHSLTYFSSKFSINGVAPNTTTHFSIGFGKGDRINLHPQNAIEITVANGSFSNSTQSKELMKIEELHLRLQAITIKYRLMRFLNELRSKGSFNYNNQAEIFKNGDIVDAKGKKANIKTAYDNKLLSFGSKAIGFRSSYNNPFELIIYSTKGLKIDILGFDLSDNMKIMTIWNKDCLDQFLTIIIKEGKI